MPWKESFLYYKQSPFQRIAFFTEKDGSFNLTLDDFLQFNSSHEHVYHESLFTLPAIFPHKLENVLVLGGGDGLGARELLKFHSIKSIELVDIDPDMIDFAKSNYFMTMLNKNSFNDPKVKVYVQDAKAWLQQPITQKYDLIIVDFPDPNTPVLWELFSSKVMQQIAARLNKHGVACLQSSTYNSRSYRKIFRTLEPIFPYILGFHSQSLINICGYFLVSFKPIKLSRSLPQGLQFLNPHRANNMLMLPVFKTKESHVASVFDYYKIHP
jgi:spermidine synthase